MTDLNEKLKLVAEYDGYEVLETGTVTLGQLKKNQTIIPLCDYDSDYQRQIPVWQKVCKGKLTQSRKTLSATLLFHLVNKLNCLY